MSSRTAVGVLGATGVVGRNAVRALRALGIQRLRLGSRHPDARAPVGISRASRPAGHAVEAVRVDLGDWDSLTRFCRGCAVVLNCAGPSYLVRGRVAQAAHAVGADYVDVAGDEPAHTELRGLDLADRGRCAVLSAGMLPGLSGLLPRWLVRQCLPRGRQEMTGGRLRAWTGGLDRCSRTVAVDLVLSVAGPGITTATADSRPAPHGTPGAAWRQGRRVGGLLSAEDAVEVPFHPERVAVQPYVSAEAERLARELSLDALDWFNVFPGRHVRQVLISVSGRPMEGPGSLAVATDRLVRAAELDLADRRPYYRMVFALDLPCGAATAVLGTCDSYRLTATMGAFATCAALAGRIPPGLHYAAEVLNPDETVRHISAAPGVTIEVAHEPLDLSTTAGAV